MCFIENEHYRIPFNNFQIRFNHEIEFKIFIINRIILSQNFNSV